MAPLMVARNRRPDGPVRAGLIASEPREPFVQTTSAMGARYNLDNVGEVIEMLEGPTFWHE